MRPTPEPETLRAIDGTGHRPHRLRGSGPLDRLRSLAGSLATAVFIAGAMMLPGCSDPGSGGTGVPGSAAAPTTDPRRIEGTIEALDATTLTVNAARIDYTRATITRADDSAATAADLRIGQPVSITLTAEGATSAERIVIR